MRSFSLPQSFSTPRPSLSPVRWIVGTLLLVLVAAGAAFAQDDGEAVKSAAEASESADASATESDTSDDGIEWLTDEDGSVYRLVKLAKVEGTYRRLGDDRVRLAGGATFLVVDETEDEFTVRVPKRERQSRRERVRPRISAEERQQAIAEFQHDAETTDRLTLEAYDEGLPRRGQWRNGFDIADMNGDGHDDIVFGPARKGRPRPTIFLGDGHGTWRVWSEARFEPAPYDYGDVAVADWNGDGHNDLVIAAHLRGLLALVGDGKGNFELATEGIDFDLPGSGEVVAAFSSRAIGVADWDGDGRTDILALGEGPKRAGNTSEIVQNSSGFRVFLNQDDGTWSAHEPAQGSTNFGDDFALLDIDGEGRDDLVTATSRLGNKWLVLKRSEGLAAEYEELDLVRDQAFVDSLAVADFDGDGHSDLALGYRALVIGKWRSGVDVLLRREGQGWERRIAIALPQREAFRSLDVGDLDGDGHQDIASLDDFGRLYVLLGDGDGGFLVESTPESPTATPGCRGYEIALRDLNGDGLPEIVAAFAGEQQGMAAFTGRHIPGCKDGGSLRAWSPRVRPAENEPGQAADGGT